MVKSWTDRACHCKWFRANVCFSSCREGDITNISVDAIVHSSNRVYSDKSSITRRLLAKAGLEHRYEISQVIKGNVNTFFNNYTKISSSLKHMALIVSPSRCFCRKITRFYKRYLNFQAMS